MPATLRRTRRLLTQLPDAGDATTPASTALGDWYVNRFQLGRTPWLLAVSETTYLAIVLHARDVRTLPARFPAAVAARLARFAFPADMVAREIAAMQPMAVGPTASRRVLGVMNDFVETARVMHALERLEDGDPRVAIEEALVRTPLFASRRADEVVFPQDAVVVAMMARWGDHRA